jgi:hypothetical protein
MRPDWSIMWMEVPLSASREPKIERHFFKRNFVPGEVWLLIGTTMVPRGLFPSAAAMHLLVRSFQRSADIYLS